MTDCPCGSTAPYSSCCEPYITEKAIAPTAEALMRSRYTAYVVGNIEYLLASHHASKRAANARNQLKETIANTQWLGLTVLETEAGKPDDTNGVVEFVARYQPNGSKGKKGAEQIHERSKFLKRKGRWFYLDGTHLPPLNPKGNEPCWCGSRKKFKNCHG